MRSDPSSQAGFSLVETIAAMGILALTAVPLMQLASDATNNAANLENRLLARTVAENVLARALVQPETIDGGIQQGRETQMGRSYTWSMTASPARVGEVQSLLVTVQLEDGTQTLARMESLKAIARPVAPVESGGADTANEGDEE
ncbi:MAG: type II secretion system minor pseudopilin GspI [Henriciella sp.]